MLNFIGIWLTMLLGCFLYILTYIIIRRFDNEENIYTIPKTDINEIKNKIYDRNNIEYYNSLEDLN